MTLQKNPGVTWNVIYRVSNETENSIETINQITLFSFEEDELCNCLNPVNFFYLSRTRNMLPGRRIDLQKHVTDTISPMHKLAVTALGGNALLRENEKGTIEEQEENAAETIENLIFLIRDGYDLVITHGNGPQVGNILMRNDAGEQLYGIAPMPLDICVADSQGGIGYMIERMLRNVLNKHGILKNVVTLVNMVLVDPLIPPSAIR